jgi:hypothetical protein
MLEMASIGIDKSETVEQSDCFVFTEGHLITFNDEIFTCQKCDLDLDAVVRAGDLVKLLGKMPDEDLDIQQDGKELVITGKKKRRGAGITIQEDVHLPFDEVPEPETFAALGEGFQTMLVQASRICTRDIMEFKTTMVHVTQNLVEACDNYRLFRASWDDNGMTGDVMVPASSIAALRGVTIEKGCCDDRGWIHLLTDKDQTISIRVSDEPYMEGIGNLLEVEGDTVTFPKNLSDIVDRASVMSEPNSLLSIRMGEGQLELQSMKDGAWYRERKKISYKGPSISFMVNPKFIIDVLKRSHRVIIGDNVLKIETALSQFVVMLEKVKKEDPVFGETPF